MLAARCPTSRSSRRRAPRSPILGAALAATSVLLTRVTPACAATAGAVTAEVGGGESTPQPTVQPSPFEYQRIAGRYEPTDTFYLSASLRLQHDFPSLPFPDTSLRSGDDWIWSGTLDASYDLGKHFTVAVGGNGSAPSTRDIASSFQTAAASTANATMRTKAWSAGGTVEGIYDTFDEDGPERPLDGSFDLSFGYTHYWTEQAMTELDTANGPMDAGTFLSAPACNRKVAVPLCEVVQRAQQTAFAELGQYRLGLTGTATILEHTDASLDFAYYLYDQAHPDQVGFWSDTPSGTKQVDTYGAGLPLIPPQWTLRPEVAHKWKTVSARLWYQYSDYTLPDYQGHAVGGKLQLYLGEWRLYVSGNFRADVSPGGTQSNAQSWTAGLGLTREL